MCEQYFDETSTIYPTFLQKMDATHIIGRLGRTKSDVDYLAPSSVRLADAILDLLVHGAIKLELKGESMRKKLNSLADTDHLS